MTSVSEKHTLGAECHGDFGGMSSPRIHVAFEGSTVVSPKQWGLREVQQVASEVVVGI